MRFILLILTTFTISLAAKAQQKSYILTPTESQFVPPFGPNLLKVRVLDCFGKLYSEHGRTVKNIVSFFFASPANGLPYNIDLSYDNIMLEDDTNQLVASLYNQGVADPATYIRHSVINQFTSALDKAGQDGVKVINYSLVDQGDTEFNVDEYNQITVMLDRYDMILVVPSGNENVGADRYPCSYKHPNIICVAAGRMSYVENGRHNDGIVYAPYSNDNLAVQFVANGDFAGEYGTSYSAPRVTSALGFIWSQNPSMTSQEVLRKLHSYGKFVDTVYLSYHLTIESQIGLFETETR